MPAALIPLLKDPEAIVRTAAVYSAGRCDDKKDFEHMLPLLDDADPQTRYTALRAFAALNDARNRPH